MTVNLRMMKHIESVEECLDAIFQKYVSLIWRVINLSAHKRVKIGCPLNAERAFPKNLY
jgi:hypothetical protein